MNELANATLAAPAIAPDALSAEMAAPAPETPAAPVALPSPLDAVQAGQLPAISLAAFAEGDPLHEFIVANFNALPDLGLDYAEFEGADGVSAIFNPAKITEADLKAAYKAGKLEQVAPPAAAAMEAAAAPVPAPEAVLAAEAPAAAAPLAGVSIPAPNAPAGVQEARARNLEAVVAPKVNVPSGGPGAAMARRAF
jgi:hypothetical protein